MLERMTVGRAELGGVVDIAAEFEHAVVVALEDGLLLLRRHIELLEILRFVRLERLAVLVLHQRHAEHVDAVALARALGVEYEGAGNVVIFLLLAGHWASPGTAGNDRRRHVKFRPDIYGSAGLCNVTAGAAPRKPLARRATDNGAVPGWRVCLPPTGSAAREGQSALTPVASTTGFQRARSLMMNSRVDCGVAPMVGSMPILSNCSSKDLSAITMAVAPCSLSTTSAGVPAGTATAFHSAAANPLLPSASSTVGMSGASGERFGKATARMRMRPSR